MLAVGTAGATGILRSAVEVFSPLFGGAPAQTEIIDKIGYPVGASDTDNGVTVTADAVMGDAYNAVIVYTISRDDGTAVCCRRGHRAATCCWSAATAQT